MNDGNIPKPLSLDDTKPTKQQLHEAYEVALRLWQLQPWDMPMGENQLLAVEASSHFAMGATIVSPPDGRELDWTPAVDFMLKTMLQFGYRPRRLAVMGESLKSVASGLCRTTFKGTEFLPHSECDALREVFYLFTEGLGR